MNTDNRIEGFIAADERKHFGEMNFSHNMRNKAMQKHGAKMHE